MSVILYSQFDNGGANFSFAHDTPVMPPNWDAHSLSCIIDYRDIPCWFCSLPNYQGLVLELTRGGGCNNLDALPGGWNNKIRSIKFGHGIAAEGQNAQGRLMPYARNPELVAADKLYPGYNTVYFVDRFMTGGDVWDIEWQDVDAGGQTGTFRIAHGSPPIPVTLRSDGTWSHMIYKNLTLNSYPVDIDFLKDGEEVLL